VYYIGSGRAEHLKVTYFNVNNRELFLPLILREEQICLI